MGECAADEGNNAIYSARLYYGGSSLCSARSLAVHASPWEPFYTGGLSPEQRSFDIRHAINITIAATHRDVSRVEKDRSKTNNAMCMYICSYVCIHTYIHNKYTCTYVYIYIHTCILITHQNVMQMGWKNFICTNRKCGMKD